MSNKGIRALTLNGMFVALVAVATMVIHIPTPATNGFVNVGDTVIFIAAVLMGPRTGILAGGIGSALADLLLGYSHWAPWTLVIKGIEGAIVGLLAYGAYRRSGRVSLITTGATIIAAVWMVFGYYVAGGIMKGFAVSLTSVPGNIVQGGSSVVFSLVALYAIQHTAVGRLTGTGQS